MRKLSILIILVFICIKTAHVYAYDILPGLDIDTSYEENYKKYEIMNYCFDAGKTSMLEVTKIFNDLASIVFLLGVFLTKITTSIMLICFEVDIFNIVGDLLDKIVFALKSSVFDEWIGIFIALYAIYAFIEGGRRGVAAAGRRVIALFLVIGIIVIFYLNPSGIVSTFNNVSKNISYTILNGVVKVVGDTGIKQQGEEINLYKESDAAVLLANLIWEVNVIKPWGVIEFGENVDSKKAASYLQWSEIDPERKNLAKAEEKNGNIMFTKVGYIIRMVMAVIMTLVMLVADIVIILICLPMVFNQVSAVVLVALSGIIFLAALFPRNDPLNIIEKFFLKLGGFLFLRILATFMVSIYFAISLVLYSLTGKYNWFIITILQIIVVIGVIVKKKDLEKFVSDMFQGGQTSLMDQRGGKSTFGQKMLGVSASIQNIKGARKTLSKIKENRKRAKYIRFYRKNRKLAQDVLTRKYQRERAQKTDFVKKVDENIKRGLEPFDEKDIKSVIDEMKQIQERGGDYKALVLAETEGLTREQIKQKQKELEERIKKQRYELIRRSRINEAIINEQILNDPKSKYHKRLHIIENTERAVRNVGRKSYDATIGATVNKLNLPEGIKTTLDPRREYRETLKKEGLEKLYSGKEAVEYVRNKGGFAGFTAFAETKLSDIFADRPVSGYRLNEYIKKLKEQREMRLKEIKNITSRDRLIHANDVISAYRQQVEGKYTAKESVNWFSERGAKVGFTDAAIKAIHSEFEKEKQIDEEKLNLIFKEMQNSRLKRIKELSNPNKLDKKFHANDFLQSLKLVNARENLQKREAKLNELHERIQKAHKKVQSEKVVDSL